MKAFSWTYRSGLVVGIDVSAEPEDSLRTGWGTCLGVPVDPSLCPRFTEVVFNRVGNLCPVDSNAADSGIVLRLGLETIPDAVDDRILRMTNVKLEEVSGTASCICKNPGYGFSMLTRAVDRVMFLRTEPWLVVLPVGARVVFGFHGVFRQGTLKLALENKDGHLEGLDAFENAIKC